MDIQISGTHQATYKALFQHPVAQNLQWHDVRSLLNSISEVEEEHNGNLRFTRHGEIDQWLNRIICCRESLTFDRFRFQKSQGDRF